LKLEDAVRLAKNSNNRIVTLVDIALGPNGKDRMWLVPLWREAWINLKRSWDLFRIVFFQDKRTRISPRQAIRWLLFGKYPNFP
jgi:hypothetical protein